jgi:hypothetical protein
MTKTLITTGVHDPVELLLELPLYGHVARAAVEGGFGPVECDGGRWGVWGVTQFDDGSIKSSKLGESLLALIKV